MTASKVEIASRYLELLLIHSSVKIFHFLIELGGHNRCYQAYPTNLNLKFFLKKLKDPDASFADPTPFVLGSETHKHVLLEVLKKLTIR